MSQKALLHPAYWHRQFERPIRRLMAVVLSQRGFPATCLLPCFLVVVVVLARVPHVRADVGPPVKISVVAPAHAATSGQIHASSLEIQVGGVGQIEALSLEGKGWRVISFEPPLKRPLKAGDVLRVPFRAVPTDASKPLRVRLTFNGRTIGKTLDFSPQYFARAGKPRPTVSVEGIRTYAPLGPIPAADWPHAIHFHGRLVYDRVGRDTSNPPDGIDDIPAQTVGVDGIPFQIIDLDDDIYDEEMYSGRTDQDGYFDVTINWDDCDILGCDDPDIYIRWECDTGTVNVQSAGIIEEDYSWSTEDTELISNFTGNEVDFGWLRPTDSGDHPALHIFNSIVRAHRFIETRAGLDVPEVDLQWPADDTNSYYDPFFNEIHIVASQQWQESTHVHEYGHHFLELFTTTVAPDYCNDFCDEDPSWPFPDCGHCMWCPENNHDAWNEGWPNWLADVFTRSHQADYGYPTLWTRSLERTRICDQDNDGNADPSSYVPWRTEGYIGALMRDIEDNLEDQDNDGVADVQPICARDALSLGPEAIFTVVWLDMPGTPSQFINAFRDRYPQYDNLLWQTANNVAPEFAWEDVAQPSAVVTVVSSSHPIGVGGNSPWIHVQWDLPSDDASGVDGYSVQWSQSPATIPDFVMDLSGPDTEVRSPPLGLGQWYFSIRTHDCAGNWDDDAAVFGPFEVTECNGNGIVDLCDTGCHFADDWCNVPGCGGEPDCNINGVPDTCDVADGASNDCNLNGIPDECDAVSFAGWRTNVDGFWHEVDNWYQGQLPGVDDYVCIDIGQFDITVTHSVGDTSIRGLGCDEALVHSGGSLVLAERSLVGRAMTVSHASLGGDGNLTVEGLLTLSQATLAGNGRLMATGGMVIDNTTVTLRDARALDNHDIASFEGNSPLILMLGNSRLYNTGTFRATNGGTIQLWDGAPKFDNWGRFEKSGAGLTDITAFFTNADEIDVQGGTLVLRGGSLHTGAARCLGSPDAVLKFGAGTHSFSAGSRVEAGNVVFDGGQATIDGIYDVTGTTRMITGMITFTPAGDLRSLGPELIVIASQNYSVSAFFNNDEPITIETHTQGYNGYVYFNTGQPVNITNHTQAGGRLAGMDNVLVSGPLLWSGGSMEGTGQTYANGGMTINGAAALADSRTLNNPLTTVFTGASASLRMQGNSRFNNAGTFNAESDGAMSQYGSGQFDNGGQFNKLGPGTMAVGVAFNNTGTVDVRAGTLQLSGGSNITNTGSFSGDPSAVLQFNSYPYTLGDTSSVDIGHVAVLGAAVTAGGSYQVTGSTTISGTLTFPVAGTLLSLGNTLTITGTANFNNDEPINVNTFNLSGGTANFNTGRPVTVSILNQTGGFLAGNDTLTVTGPATWSSGYMQGGGRTHTDGGLSITGYVVLRDSVGSRTLQMSQTTSLSGAAHVVMSGASSIINQGTFDALADGPIEHWSGTPRFTNNGTFNKLGPGTLPFSVACTNTGRFDVQAGLLQLSRAYTQTAGTTVLNGGNVQSAQTLDIQGGQLAGAGTITANVTSGGTVSPGTSTGILNISGNYTQNAAGELEIEIGGPDPAGQFDQLRIAGSAALAGRLRLTLIDDYSPSPGATFTIMTFGSRSGELTEVIGPAANRFTVTHNANDITLNAVPPAPADSDGDGDVDLDDFVSFEACASGPGVAQDDPECAWARLDLDEDVDQSDFAVFQRCFSGEDAPADVACAE